MTNRVDPEVAFLPMADPDRRQLDPIAALVAARDLRTLIGAAEYDAVDWARQAGWTWAQIGEAMGTSKQAAQQRFGVVGYDAPHRPGCAHALNARNCPEVGGPCPDARDALIEVHRDGCRCGMTADCAAHLDRG